MNTKSSATLRFLESHAVFTREEFESEVDPTVSPRTRHNNLRNAVRREQARRIAHGLYVSNIGVFRNKVPSPLLVASKVAPGAVLAYHSALEAHGVAHTSARTIYYLSDKQVAPFSIHGYRVRRAPSLSARSPATAGLTLITQARVGDTLVVVTSRERTLVDCLARLDLAGGLEELLRSVGSFTTMTSADVARYVAALGSPTLAARAGWLMSLMASDWLFDPRPVEDLRSSLKRGTYWLQRRRSDVEYEFVSPWRLYVPAGLPYLDWLHG